VGVAGDGRGDDEGAARRRPHWPEPDRPGEKGAKRSLLCEGKGIPLGIADEGANRVDFKLSRQTLESIPIERPEPSAEQPQNLCLDKGYDYDEVRELLDEFGFTAHIRSRGEEAKAIANQAGFRARRWVVERTHSWLNRCRALLIRWSKKPENHLAFLHLACALITWKTAIATHLPG
jgi:putative transposase